MTNEQIKAKAKELAALELQEKIKEFEKEYQALCDKYNLIIDFQTRVIVRPLKSE
jgi:hypothetical protein